MKKTYTLFIATMFSLGLFAQMQIDPSLDADFSEDAVQTVQLSASPIQSQVLFSGIVDSVSYVNNYGDSAGMIPARQGHDFIGITPDGDDFWISVNHETRSKSLELGDGASMTTFKVERDSDDLLKVVETTLNGERTAKFHNVDFYNHVGETWTNCGGITSPTGRIFTAEEYPVIELLGGSNASVASFVSDTGDVIIGEGIMMPFNENNSLEEFRGERLKKFESQGWMVEIDPVTSKAIRKQYNWGRMSFEAGAMTDDMKTVYLAEDQRPGLFTKFEAETAGDFTKGKLYVYKQDGGDAGNWIEVPQDLDKLVNLNDWAWANGATYFIRLEWVTIIDGKVYIAETGYDNVCKKSSWIKALGDAPNGDESVAYHHHKRAAIQETVFDTTGTNSKIPYHDYYGRVLCYDPAVDSVYSYLEGGPESLNNVSDSTAVLGGNYPEIHLSNPDGLGKVTINGQNYMILCEDLNGTSYNRVPSNGTKLCEMYLLDMSISTPSLNDLVRIYVGPAGSELTGGNGTQDGKSILVDIQHPSSSNAEPYNHAATVALNNLELLPRVSAASFPTDWSDGSMAQVTSTIISEQILFRGGVDTVSYLDNYRKPAGFTTAREGHDFIGISQLDTETFLISVNHESKYRNDLLGNGSGMTTFKIARQANGDFDVLEDSIADGRKAQFHTVDFINTVGETWTNCGGIIAPDGRIWTAEEYPAIESWGGSNANVTSFLADTGDVVIGEGMIVPFNSDNAIETYKGERLKKFENQGWMVEVDPKTGKAIRKYYNWGRMSYEAGVIMSDNKTVYLAEDERPGIFTKFVADVAGDFTEGTLYVYKQDGGDTGNWIEVPQDLETLVNLKEWAWKNKATFFIRLEWITEVDGKVYICETGYDNVAKKTSWLKALELAGTQDVIAAHHVVRAEEQGTKFDTTGVDDMPYHDYYGRILEFDPATDKVEVYLEGGAAYDEEESQTMSDYPEKHLSNPDGLGRITIKDQDYLIICEDLNGTSYNRIPSDGEKVCEMYLLDMSVENPTVDDLTRIMVGPAGAELTGGTGTADGNTILVNVQHPSGDNTAPYNYASTVALTGWNEEVDITDNVLDSNNEFEFVVMPNPATRYIKFNGSYDVTIYNAIGTRIKSAKNTTSINVSDLNSGIYFISNSQGQTVRLIVE